MNNMLFKIFTNIHLIKIMEPFWKLWNIMEKLWNTKSSFLPLFRFDEVLTFYLKVNNYPNLMYFSYIFHHNDLSY